MEYFVSAVIAAAGNSTRMGGGKSKQFLDLLGKPAVSYTLSAFQNCDLVNEIIFVCRLQDRDELLSVVNTYGISKFKCAVNGGETRAQSVNNGISELNEKATHILIHDGARPLILPDEISKTVLKAFECSACAIGIPVVDTIKVVSKNGEILSTPDRKSLFAVQTPQVFEKELYFKAICNSENLGEEITDDCKLIEMLGEKVCVVCAESENFKLTSPEDILYAEAVLKKRGCR